ncbi:MAG TPA: DUF3209 family protein [Candidatus Binataceae bacterium]|nr:DUF3209 family protein [Candidatus Binataceae bacterium]
MACHEIAGLRLGLMGLLGLRDEAARQHELAELGDGADRPGPVRSMCQARDLDSLRQFYESAVSMLEERVANTGAADAKLPYLRSLVILTKKVEMELANQIDALTRLFHDLEQMHDFVHEIYPAD